VERAGEGARLAGTRLGIVLRPPGFAATRPLDLDDGESLAAAAELLARGGRAQAALEYAERAVEASPRAPIAQRVLGDVALSLGGTARALQAYRAYLHLAPDAADRDDVERRMQGLRGDPAVPGVRVRRGAPGGGGSG
jgi:tetratricopeptide (TPR) repeat protein